MFCVQGKNVSWLGLGATGGGGFRVCVWGESLAANRDILLLLYFIGKNLLFQ